MKLYVLTGENGKLNFEVEEVKVLENHLEEIVLKKQDGTMVYGIDFNKIAKNGSITKGSRFSVKGLCRYRVKLTLDNYLRGLKERGYQLIEDKIFTMEELQEKFDMINIYLKQLNELLCK